VGARLRQVESVSEGAELLQEAVKAARRGDSGVARTLLLRASVIEPALDLIWLWLAQLSSSPSDKESYLRHVLAMQPEHKVARAGLADLLCEEGITAAKTGSRTRARELLARSIELDRDKQEAWLWLAAVAESGEDRRRDLAQVLAIEPGHRQALALLALLDARPDEDDAGSAEIGTSWQHLLLEPEERSEETREIGTGGLLRNPFGNTADRETNLENHTNKRSSAMASIKESLQSLAEVDGFIGTCLVDSNSGMMMGSEGGGTIDLEAAAAGNTEVVRAKRKTMATLGLKDGIEDILITLGKQYHLIRPLTAKDGLFIYLVLDKGRSNLALARHKLASTEKDLVV